jgi:hypothetical protein
MDSLTVGINKLSIRPGDVVLVTLPDGDMTPTVMDEISKAFKESLGEDFGLLFRSASLGLTILRNGQPVAPEVDAPIEVEVR